MNIIHYMCNHEIHFTSVPCNDIYAIEATSSYKRDLTGVKTEYVTMHVMKSHFSRVMERVRDPRFSFKSTRVIELRLTCKC